MKEIIKNLSKEKIAIIVGLLYSLVVCLHFFRPGYLRSLDYFFPLFGGIIPAGSNGFLVSIIVTIGKHIVSSQILEKTILLCAFFIPFIGGVFLTRRTQSLGAMVFAGMCMTCNPYFYDRFVDGQLGMYLLFCVIPFWIYCLYNFFSTEHKKLHNYVILVLLSLIATSISMHGAWFLLISGIVFFFVFLKHRYIQGYLWQSGILALCILVTNLYRIVPNIINVNGAQQRIQNFGTTDLTIFENYTGHTNNYIMTLSLQGYWGEGYNRFMPSYGPQQFPLMMFAILFGLIIVGIYYALHDADPRQKKFCISILILTIIGYILGLGTAGDTIFADITRFLYTHIPFYQAMRESHKRVLFMVIGYAYFGSYGVYALSNVIQSKSHNRIIISLSAIVLLLGYTPAIFLLNREIPVVDYPLDRYALRSDLLATDTCTKSTCYSTLILPRHQYMYLSFVGKNVLNPSHTFFTPLNIIAGDNIEIGSLYSQSNDPQSIATTNYLAHKNIVHTQKALFGDGSNKVFIQYLKSIGVSHIVLLKEVDYKSYDPLMTQLSEEKHIYKSLETNYFSLYTLSQ